MAMTLVGDCTNLPHRDVIATVAGARAISRRTFLRYVDREALHSLELMLGYELHPSRGMTMAADGYVTYARSQFRGRPCVYVEHSSITYIFA